MLNRRSLRQRQFVVYSKENIIKEKLFSSVTIVSTLLTGPISLCLAKSEEYKNVECTSVWQSEKPVTARPEELDKGPLMTKPLIIKPKNDVSPLMERCNPPDRILAHLTAQRLNSQTMNWENRSPDEKKQIIATIVRFEEARQPGYRTTDILKPRSDKSEYRYVVLNNGLRVMLISDKNCPKAALSWRLLVGLSQDPQHFPGISTLLAILFSQGSEKYPQTSDISNFFGQRGGSYKRMLSEQWQGFVFDIDPQYLDQLLDFSAAALKWPLMSKERLNEALTYTDSVSVISTKTDMMKYELVIKRLANPKHPLQNLSLGTFALLRDDPKVYYLNLRNALTEFHQKYVSSNIITLCVLGREPLDKLEEMVKGGRFESIENKHIPIPCGSSCILVHEPLYRPEDLGKTV